MSCILKSGIGGSSPTGIVAGSDGAAGIEIDFESRRLYWAEYWDHRISSSNLDGSDIVSIAQTLDPYGIALVGRRIYWGLFSGQVQSRSKFGMVIRNETIGTAPMRHFTAPNWSPSRSRENHCEQELCSGVCVLSSKSFKCLQ